MARLIAGAVLAGGRSTRLQRDKTKMYMHNNGVDMLHHTYACLHAIIQNCWVVCRKGQSVADLPCINDVYENVGPIAGIVAALTHAEAMDCKAVMAISCDLPLMQPAIIKRLLDTWMATQQSQLTAFFNRRTCKLEMLAAIYGINALPLFKQAIAEGHYKLNAIIPWAKTTVVFTDAETEVALFNVNTPEDLGMAQAMLAQRKSPTKQA